MGCVNWLILAAVFIFVMVSLLRWFEQTAEAVDERDWGRLTLLVLFPFAVWRYHSRVGAGRPVPVPLHEPVRGFGKVPLSGPPAPAGAATEGPPPGTPREFLGMPAMPKDVKKKPPVEPEKVARLRQKMIEQGLIKPENEDESSS
jgi:hypothetical protein